MGFSQAPGLPYSKLGIPEDGDTASRAISKGKYVIWKGKNYFAKTDILQGETFVEDTNLTEIPDGALNGIADALNASLASFHNAQLLGSGGFGSDISLSDDPLKFSFLIFAVRDSSHNDFSIAAGSVSVIQKCLEYASSTARVPISVGSSASGCLTIQSMTNNTIRIVNQAYTDYTRVDVYAM